MSTKLLKGNFANVEKQNMLTEKGFGNAKTSLPSLWVLYCRLLWYGSSLGGHV